ncbi:MAG: hypothetical protein KDN20_12445 [Verrucomicrobiae bacterium]|nr:hypothetical protein [Verrucomicrobiae bacterium]
MSAPNSPSQNSASGCWVWFFGLVLTCVFVPWLLLNWVKYAHPGYRNDQIRHFLAEIDAGLEAYRIDNGIYPLNPNPEKGFQAISVPGYSGKDAVAVAGAAVLYQTLSGDYDLDGNVDDGETVYVDRLDFWSNSEQNGRAPEVPRSVKIGSVYLVVDPQGNPVRYLSDPPGYTQEQRKTHNPTFDLWSIGDGNADDPSSWITNWGSD